MSLRITFPSSAMFVLLMAGPLSPGAFADIITWDGTCGNNLWDSTCFAGVANNWQPNFLPTTSDDAVIPDGFGVIVFNLSSQAVNSITVNGTSGLRIDGFLNVLNPSIVTGLEMINAKTLFATGPITFNGTNSGDKGILDGPGGFVNNGDFLAGISIKSLFVNQGGGTMRFSSTHQADDLVNHGTIVLRTNSLVNQSIGRIRLESGGTLELNGSAGAGQSTLGGKIEMNGGTIWINDGSMRISSGTNRVMFSGGLINLIGTGFSTLHFNTGEIHFNGLTHITGDGLLEWTTPVVIDQPLSVTVSANLLVPKSGFIPDDLHLNSDLNNHGHLLMSRIATMSGAGAINNFGTLLISNNVTFTAGLFNNRSATIASGFAIGMGYYQTTGSGTSRFTSSSGSYIVDIAGVTNAGVTINRGRTTADMGSAAWAVRMKAPYDQIDGGETEAMNGVIQFEGGGFAGNTFSALNSGTLFWERGHYMMGSAVELSGAGPIRIGNLFDGSASPVFDGGGGTITFKGSQVRLERGLLKSTGDAVYRNVGNMIWLGGSIGATSEPPLRTLFKNEGDGILSITSGISKTVHGIIINDGFVTQNDSITLNWNGRLMNRDGTWRFIDTLNISPGPNAVSGSVSVVNTGELIVDTDAATDTVTINVPFNVGSSAGKVRVSKGRLSLPLQSLVMSTGGLFKSEGTWIDEPGTNAVIQWPVDMKAIEGSVRLESDNNARLRKLERIGDGTTNSLSKFHLTGEQEIDQTLRIKPWGGLSGDVGARIRLTSDVYRIEVEHNATLGGDFTVDGNVRVDAGDVRPGQSPGVLTITGDLVYSNGQTFIEMAGTGPANFDHLVVSGTVFLAGSVVPSLIDGFLPNPGDQFVFLNAGAVSNAYEGVNLMNAGGRRTFSLAHSSTSVTLVAAMTNYATYAEWRDVVFPDSLATNSAVSGPGVDADGDGLANGLEYLFALSPGLSNANPVTVEGFAAATVTNGPQWTLTFPFAADVTDVEVVFEATDDLLHPAWTMVNHQIIATNDVDPAPVLAALIQMPTGLTHRASMRLSVLLADPE